jgi:asparagine synthase (glutamine-hydrolysing)
MCGITGVYAFNEIGRISLIHLQQATQSLAHRGPDAQDSFIDYFVGMGHCRLSIIDLSTAANQPMSDESGRYVIVFNGEIYNYRALREHLKEMGYSFRTQSDTEVLLNAYRHWGKDCLHQLHGFFAFAIYDKEDKSLFLARDRFGIKPLYWYLDENRFLFASELRAILHYGIEKKVNAAALLAYLQLNYVPAPLSMLDAVQQLEPGHFILLRKREMTKKCYYHIDPQAATTPPPPDYEKAQKTLRNLLEKSVAKRLIADVPVGTFLSGGIDSSIVSILAAQQGQKIQAFSVSFPENRFYDELPYAEAVARQYHMEHLVFELREYDMLHHIDHILAHFDEPFADSSAVAVYMISKQASCKVKAILSGDGADEVFGGYQKHLAEYYARHWASWVWLFALPYQISRHLPQHRGGFLPNKIRQFNRFVEGVRLTPQERYWRWACIAGYQQALQLLQPAFKEAQSLKSFEDLRHDYIQNISGYELNEVLHADLRLVLPNDMLKKVDSMSMAHALEVRVPFLDHEVVEFAFSLPGSYKVSGGMRKRILQDAFRELLPKMLHKRPKKGFEVPIAEWLRGPLRWRVEHEWLEKDFIQTQNIFDVHAINQLKKQLFSNNPGDAHARLWALISFQVWWKKVFQS